MLFILAICLSLLSCDLLNTSGANTTDHKMYVFSNTAQKFYLIDYRSFEVIKEIQMDILEGVSLSGMALSVNREYLFFRTYGPLPDIWTII